VDINRLPNGSRCFIDANILIYYLGGLSDEIRAFLHRVIDEEIEAHVNTVVVAEILHRRMMAEAVSKGLVTISKVLQKLKAQPQLITQLSDYVVALDDLLALPLRVTNVTLSTIDLSHHYRLSHGLFVNDSINLASAAELQITDIVTNDTDFKRVPNITVWEPTDI
jgi:predicted nucleic acid-binding protein